MLRHVNKSGNSASQQKQAHSNISIAYSVQIRPTQKWGFSNYDFHSFALKRRSAMRICTYDDKTVIETGCHIVHVNCKNRENKESYFFSQQWLQYLQGKRNLHLLVNRLACKMSIVYIEMKMCEYKEADSSSFFFFFFSSNW